MKKKLRKLKELSPQEKKVAERKIRQSRIRRNKRRTLYPLGFEYTKERR